MLDRLKRFFSPGTPGQPPPWTPPAPVEYWSPNLERAERQGEPALRQRLEQGDMGAWPQLTALLTHQGRSAEVVALREHEAATADQTRLNRLVDSTRNQWEQASRLDAAVFKRALITRFPADLFFSAADEIEECATLLAEAGLHDEALGYFREAVRLGPSGRYFLKNPLGAMKEMTRTGSLDQTEELLRLYAANMHAISALALLLQSRGRTAEGEELLRRVPEPGHEMLRLTLFILLVRDGRPDEAAAVRPEHGWFHERFGRITTDPTAAGTDRYQTIWMAVEDWGKGTVI